MVAGAGLDHALDLYRLVVAIVNGGVAGSSGDGSAGESRQSQGKKSMDGDAHFAAPGQVPPLENSTAQDVVDTAQARSPGA